MLQLFHPPCVRCRFLSAPWPFFLMQKCKEQQSTRNAAVYARGPWLPRIGISKANVESQSLDLWLFRKTISRMSRIAPIQCGR